MKTSIITDMQKSAQVVHVVASRDADPLIGAGYARRVTISPPPTQGHTAISLTTAGRGFRQSAPDPDKTSKGPVGDSAE